MAQRLIRQLDDPGESSGLVHGECEMHWTAMQVKVHHPLEIVLSVNSALPAVEPLNSNDRASRAVLFGDSLRKE